MALQFQKIRVHEHHAEEHDPAGMALKKQRELIGNGVGFWNLKASSQWHSSFNKAMPANPFHVVPPTRDQVFKLMGLWGHSHPKYTSLWTSFDLLLMTRKRFSKTYLPPSFLLLEMISYNPGSLRLLMETKMNLSFWSSASPHLTTCWDCRHVPPHLTCSVLGSKPVLTAC